MRRRRLLRAVGASGALGVFWNVAAASNSEERDEVGRGGVGDSPAVIDVAAVPESIFS